MKLFAFSLKDSMLEDALLICNSSMSGDKSASYLKIGITTN
jgi:hypothetical protein